MSQRVPIYEYFNGVYAETERFWWRRPGRYELVPEAYPTSLLTQQTLRVLQGRKPGRALDIGAGEGSDSIRLAKIGYRVDAVEVSHIGAGKIEKFAAEEGVRDRLRVFAVDILDFKPEDDYDVIICNGVLHYVEDKHSVIELMRRATVPGGINVISLWSDYTPVPDCHEVVPVYLDAEDGVVTRSYKSWSPEFIYYERAKGETSHNDMPAHSHSHIKLIAAKPES